MTELSGESFQIENYLNVKFKEVVNRISLFMPLENQENLFEKVKEIKLLLIIMLLR